MTWKGGRKGDRQKKLIICVDRGGLDEDRGWDGHVISKEHQGRRVVLLGRGRNKGRMEGEFITVEMSVTNFTRDCKMRCTPIIMVEERTRFIQSMRRESSYYVTKE
jgi:hypothetical protein